MNDKTKTPRTDAVALTIAAGDWAKESHCTECALMHARQLETELLSAQQTIANRDESIGEIEEGLRELVMLTRPGYDPSDDEGASAESVIDDLRHDIPKLQKDIAQRDGEIGRLREALNGFNYCTCGQSVHQEHCHKYRITKALSSTPGESWVPWSVVEGVIGRLQANLEANPLSYKNDIIITNAIGELSSYAPRKAGGG